MSQTAANLYDVVHSLLRDGGRDRRDRDRELEDERKDRIRERMYDALV